MRAKVLLASFALALALAVCPMGQAGAAEMGDGADKPDAVVADVECVAEHSVWGLAVEEAGSDETAIPAETGEPQEDDVADSSDEPGDATLPDDETSTPGEAPTPGAEADADGTDGSTQDAWSDEAAGDAASNSEGHENGATLPETSGEPNAGAANGANGLGAASEGPDVEDCVPTSETVVTDVSPERGNAAPSSPTNSLSASVQSANTVDFSDVSSSTPHASDIEWLASQGISTGFRHADFDPYAKVTRCDMAAFLRRTAIEMGVEGVDTWAPTSADWHRFSDVNTSTSHAEDILWLAYAQITTGFSDGTFRPYAEIARCDLAAFLRRFATYAGVPGSESYAPSSSDWRTFSDVNQSSPHAADVLWLADSGVSTGFSDGTFRPYSSVTRCDTAAFLTRIARKSGRTDASSWTPSSQDWNAFEDVSSSTPHAREILWLAHADISTGFVNYTFEPMSNVARSDMAAFLRRLAVNMGVSDAATWTPSQSDWKRFSDVSSSVAHAADILWLAHSGISTGFGNGTFRPYASVARCDMAAFLRRLAKLAGDEGAASWNLSSAYNWMGFSDVSASTPHRDDVMWLAYAGISLGYGGNTFQPLTSVARCDMAAFLHRLDASLHHGGSNSTGWIVQGSQRYYVDPMSGSRLTGWQSLGGRRYYFNADGSMYHGGWLTPNGKTYYLDPTTGIMATGDKWIDGVLRPFASNGVCLKTGYQVSWKGLHLAAENVRLPGYASGSRWNYVHPCTVSANATREQCIEAFIAVAYEYMNAGTRWVDNNCGRPGTTVDCSGLVMEGLYAAGMDLTGVAGGDYNPYSKYYWNHSFANTWRTNQTFQPVSINSIERGDIIYWDGHVAIYLGNDQIIESTSVASNVRVRSLYAQNLILGAARPFTK